MNKKAETVATYNASAQELAEKFDSQGSRKKDIDEVMKIINKKDPHVFEIGCGNGRDAQEIRKFTQFYTGLDISEKLLNLAREKVPSANFVLGDIETFVIPEHLDVVIAFASLIHVDRVALARIFQQVYKSLNKHGILRVNFKNSDIYQEITKVDEYGTRTYYLYSLEDILRFEPQFEKVKAEVENIRGQEWLDVILKRST